MIHSTTDINDDDKGGGGGRGGDGRILHLLPSPSMSTRSAVLSNGTGLTHVDYLRGEDSISSY